MVNQLYIVFIDPFFNLIAQFLHIDNNWYDGENMSLYKLYEDVHQHKAQAQSNTVTRFTIICTISVSYPKFNKDYSNTNPNHGIHQLYT